jgi:phage/plasmid-like protein (TIGR03299 family)
MSWTEALDHYSLNNTYAKRPLVALIGDGQSIEVPNLYSIVNEQTNQPLSGVAVNGRYNIIQTREFADIGDAIVRESQCEFVGGGTLMDGKGLYLQAKLPGNIRVRNTDDIIDKMLTFITSHDGTWAFMVAFMGFRLFCRNQFRAIKSAVDNDGVKIRHTASAAERLVQAQQAVLEANNAYQAVELKLNELATQRISDIQTKMAVRRLFKVKDDTPYDDIPTRTRNNMDSLMETIALGPGQDMFEGTPYNVWNGMTHWADHVRGVKKDTNRFEAGLVGSGMAFKERAIKVVEASLLDTPADIVGYPTVTFGPQ